MSAWRKRLRSLLASGPTGDYEYEELAGWLDSLGFRMMGRGGSHRTWRCQLRSGIVLRITLVKSGHGTREGGLCQKDAQAPPGER